MESYQVTRVEAMLRRLIRRAARRQTLGIEGRFLVEVVNTVIQSWKVEYAELEERKEQSAGSSGVEDKFRNY